MVERSSGGVAITNAHTLHYCMQLAMVVKVNGQGDKSRVKTRSIEPMEVTPPVYSCKVGHSPMV